MPTFVEKQSRGRPFVSGVFLLIYLLLTLSVFSVPLIYQNLPIVREFNLEQSIVLVPAAVAAAYFGIIAFSFFVRGDNWLIFTIILLFFSSLGALGLAAIGSLNGRNLLQSGIPDCLTSLVSCNSEEGVVLLSAVLLGISIPLLILNIATFFAAMKTMGAND